MCAYVLLEEHSDYRSLSRVAQAETGLAHKNAFSDVVFFYKSDTKPEHAEKSERKYRELGNLNKN